MSLKHLNGVRGAADEIEVMISDILQRSDTIVATAIVEALRSDTAVPDEHIQVSATKGGAMEEHSNPVFTEPDAELFRRIC